MGRLHLLLLLALAGPSWAAEETELASSFDEDDPFDFNIRVRYERESRQTAIKREFQCDPNDPGFASCISGQTGINIVKDLRYRQLRNILNLRGEIGIWKDLQLHVEAPLVLGDHRELEFDHNTDGPCITGSEVQPGGDPTNDVATCVDNRNSTTIRDGLIPGIGRDSDYDRQLVAGEDIDPGAPGMHLPVRSGLDQLYVGIDWGVLSQERDETKPTWVVGFEWRIPVADHMTYDRNDPKGETSVGRGIHELRWSTSISKRWTYIEPFMSFWYMLPIAKDDALFKDYGGGQDKVRPQQRAGTDFGFEIIPWQRPTDNQKLSIELGGGIHAMFEGRGYSEMWEVFFDNPTLDGPCLQGWANCSANRPVEDLDGDGTLDGRDFDGDGLPDAAIVRHPGITDIENYLTLKTHTAVRVQMGDYIKFRIGVGLEHDQEHIITFTDGGEDVNGNGFVDPTGPDAPREVHPLHRPLLDQTGRRYRAEDTFVFTFFAHGILLF